MRHAAQRQHETRSNLRHAAHIYGLLPPAQEFCAHKAADAAATGAQEDSETWTFMGVLFEEDARRQLLSKLGFAEALQQAAAPAAGSGSGDAAGGLAGSSSVDVAGQQLHSAMEQLGLGDGEFLLLWSGGKLGCG